MDRPEDLAVRAAEDPAAFASLFDRYYKRVNNYVHYRCTDWEAAEELCADIFERVLASIGAYRPERGAFEPWLFAIARRAVSDHWRAYYLRKLVPFDLLRGQPAPAASPEEQVLAGEELRQLKAALTHLTGHERDLLGLKFAAGLTNREIARLTGLTESNTGVLLHRAIQKLRSLYGQNNSESIQIEGNCA